jgi:hypothetical protein
MHRFILQKLDSAAGDTVFIQTPVFDISVSALTLEADA